MGVKERKEREKEQRRKLILQAGEKIFISRGLRATTMEMIANECEISRGTLYLYFQNKADLFAAIIVNGLSILIDMIKTCCPEREAPEAKLLRIGKIYLEFYRRHRDVFMLMVGMEDHEMSESMRRSENAKELIRKNQEIWDIVTRVICEGAEAKTFRSDIDPYQMAIMAWATSNGIISAFDHMMHVHKLNIQQAAQNGRIDYWEQILSKMDLDNIMEHLWNMTSNYILNKTTS